MTELKDDLLDFDFLNDEGERGEGDIQFSFDEQADVLYREVDLCGLVLKLKSKERKLFDINEEINQLSQVIKAPPSAFEEFKMLSIGGGFSSIAIIKYIAEREKILKLYCSTFRIGKKQFEIIETLNDRGRIKDACFITSTTQKKTDTVYDYYSYILKSCKKRGFSLKCYNNHSKLILMRTKKNYYVIETSSNLNENPKIEQFNFENDRALFLWYEKFFKELLK